MSRPVNTRLMSLGLPIKVYSISNSSTFSTGPMCLRHNSETSREDTDRLSLLDNSSTTDTLFSSLRAKWFFNTDLPLAVISNGSFLNNTTDCSNCSIISSERLKPLPCCSSTDARKYSPSTTGKNETRIQPVKKKPNTIINIARNVAIVI